MRITILASLAILWLAAPAGARPSECSDFLDNDGDTSVDYPADLDCDSSKDDSEQCEGAHCPACSNGLDDDGDGDIDWPADTSCSGPDSDTEVTECSDGKHNDWDLLIDFPADPGCYGYDDETETDPLLVCDDGISNDGDPLPDMLDAGCSDPLDPTETDPELVCDDGLDNDGDGLIDWPADPGCQHGGQLSLSEECDCWDGFDNDGDTVIDDPMMNQRPEGDYGCRNQLCSSREDPECSNHRDDDGDGYCDTLAGYCVDGAIPGDPECGESWWDSESSARPVSIGCGLGVELVLLLPLLIGLQRLRRRRSVAPAVVALLVLSLPLLGCAASNWGVIAFGHAINEAFTAVPEGFVDTATDEGAWIEKRWLRALTYPVLAPVRFASQIGAAFAVNATTQPAWEFVTYDNDAGYGRGVPFDPDPPYTWMPESWLLPNCDYPWAGRAPRCLDR